MLTWSILIYVVTQCAWLNRCANGLDCYHCQNIPDITACHTVIRCNQDEICLSTELPTTTTMSSLSIVGRDVSSTVDCSQCCAVDACNKKLCTTGTQALGSSECQDDPEFDCPTVSSVVNLCSDRHHAKLKCKRFCGLCNMTDGNWSSWQPWSSCSVSCGPGTKARTRACDNPAPYDGGLDCVGEKNDQTTCNIRDCPVNGNWSIWSSWGTCSVTCGIGLEWRDRTCSSPHPSHAGEPCSGDTRDARVCYTSACADGNWASWSSWGSCTASCLGGIQSRTRPCTNPVPSTFGHDCIGNSEENKVCNAINCPETNGGWSSWTSWGSCSNAIKRRTRLCNNPIPSQRGQNCLGNNEQIAFCGEAFGGVRLVGGGGHGILSGRVEVFHTKWGTVCDDSFSSNDAKVVCRMLGLETNNPYALWNAHFGQGSLPIILDDLTCHGTEESIYSCGHRSWFANNCGHGEDAGVVCAPLIRLVGGSRSGRLEVKYNGGWGTVCDDGFSNNAARVVCRSLGYPTAHARVTDGHGGSGAILLDDVSCTGTEHSIEECQHSTWASHDCDHGEDVGITCY